MQGAISQSHINFTVSFLTYFYVLSMPVDIYTWRAGLFVDTTQQYAVFHLTKFRDSTLYNMLLFLLLLIVFKEFSNNRDLILGTFLFLWPKGFFLETKLAIKDGHSFRASLYTFSSLSLEISFVFTLLLTLCGDVEVNRGPGHWTSLSFCHWNLNSISPLDFVKVSILEAYNAIDKFDAIFYLILFLAVPFKVMTRV